MPVDPDVLANMRRRQRSYWPDGHLHIGDSVPGKNGGVRPVKLFTFRFTSPSRAMIEAAADLYGGTVAPMTRGMDRWQVVTDADEIPVYLPRHPVSQWLELWDGPYCMRRCDGATIEQKSGRPCLCKAERVLRCELRTRLSVLPQDLPSLGTWLLVSGGLNAAEDLPARAVLADKIGDYVDARLMVIKAGVIEDGKPVTFPIPRLRIEEAITPRQVLTGTIPPRTAARSGVPQLPAGTSKDAPTGDTGSTTPPDDHVGQPPIVDYIAQASAAATAEQVRAIWVQASQAGHLTQRLRIVLNALGATLPGATSRDGHKTPSGLHEPATEQPPVPEERTPHAPRQDAPRPNDASAPDTPTPLPGQGEQPADRLRERILHLWQGGTSALYEAFFARYATTMRHASLDQLQEFAALCEQVHANDTATPGTDVVDGDVVDGDAADPPAGEPPASGTPQ